MVNLIRHFVAALVVFSVLMSLYGSMYFGAKDYYGFTDTYTGEGDKSLPEMIESLTIVQRLNDIMQGFMSVVAPTNPLDLVGGLMMVAFGLLGTLIGIFTLPVEIFGIATGFYYIPPIVCTGLGVIILVYLGFILLSSKLRGDV